MMSDVPPTRQAKEDDILYRNQQAIVDDQKRIREQMVTMTTNLELIRSTVVTLQNEINQLRQQQATLFMRAGTGATSESQH